MNVKNGIGIMLWHDLLGENTCTMQVEEETSSENTPSEAKARCASCVTEGHTLSGYVCTLEANLASFI